jgi:DNA-binding CsgD family transcriptional regulator
MPKYGPIIDQNPIRSQASVLCLPEFKAGVTRQLRSQLTGREALRVRNSPLYKAEPNGISSAYPCLQCLWDCMQSIAPSREGFHAKSERRPSDLPALISGIGEDDFDLRLISYLHQVCSAEHCSIFQLATDRPSRFASASLDGTDTARRQAGIYMSKEWWRRDPMFIEAQRRVDQAALSVLRTDVRKLDDHELREQVYERSHICERVLLCGDAAAAGFGLSILRSERAGTFLSDEISRLQEIGRVLLSVIAKHARIRRKEDASRALTSLEEIEDHIQRAPQLLSRREAQVCARILYGLTTGGVALDLDIGEETVMTYRKRAYTRLRVGSYRELLLWYLDL